MSGVGRLPQQGGAPRNGGGTRTISISPGCSSSSLRPMMPLEASGRVDWRRDRRQDPCRRNRPDPSPAGVYRRSVQLASGRYAVLQSGREFSLVSWRPVIEQRLGPSLAATVRGSQSSWELGPRPRPVTLISPNALRGPEACRLVLKERAHATP